MQVLDIIQSAAIKAGVIPSFNPDEMPGDVIETGRNVLVSEILPALNCDRTIDITVTSRVYMPEHNIIQLVPFRQPNENFEIIGYTDKRSIDIDTQTAMDIVLAKRPDWGDGHWPTNDLNEYRTAAFWTIDNRLAIVKHDGTVTFDPDANIDFPPMRVIDVLDECPRLENNYVYREEFEKILPGVTPGVYTTEEYEDRIVILLNGLPGPKRVVLPVPLQIINRDHSHAGEILPPAKFQPYLTDCPAIALAIIYGVSTDAAMEKEAAKSYNLIKKNKPQPRHEANVSERIGEKLRIRLRGRFYGYY